MAKKPEKLVWHDVVDEAPSEELVWHDVADKQEEPQPTQKEEVLEPSSGVRRVFGDIGVGVTRGAAKLPNIAFGLADMVSGGAAGKFAEDKLGYDFKAADRFYNPLLSHETQEAQRKVSEAKGFVPTVKAAVQNPSAVVQAVSESVPSMLTGGAIGKAVMYASKAPAAVTYLAGALGEGIVGAGQTAEDVRLQTADRRLTWKQSLLSAGVGVGTSVVGGVSGKFSKMLGIADIDTVLAGGTATEAIKEGAKKSGLIKRVGGAMVSEGALEEMPQSALETIGSNAALDKPLDEGLGNSMGMGLVTGAAMGGAVNAKPALVDQLSGALARRKQEVAEINAMPAVDAAGSSNALAAALQTNPAVAIEIPTDNTPIFDQAAAETASPDAVTTETREALEEIIATGPAKDKPKAWAALKKLRADDEKRAAEEKKLQDESTKELAGKEKEATAHSDAIPALASTISTAKANLAAAEAKNTAFQLQADETIAEIKATRAPKGQKVVKDASLKEWSEKKVSANEDLKVAQHNVSLAEKALSDHMEAQPQTIPAAIDPINEQIPQETVSEAIEPPVATSSEEAIVAPAPEAVLATREQPEIATQQIAGQTLDMAGLQQSYEAIAPHIRKFADGAIKVAKDLADFTKRMVAKYGPKIAEQAKAIWEYAKNIQPGLSIQSLSKEEAAAQILAKQKSDEAMRDNQVLARQPVGIVADGQVVNRGVKRKGKAHLFPKVDKENITHLNRFGEADEVAHQQEMDENFKSAINYSKDKEDAESRDDMFDEALPEEGGERDNFDEVRAPARQNKSSKFVGLDNIAMGLEEIFDGAILPAQNMEGQLEGDVKHYADKQAMIVNSIMKQLGANKHLKQYTEGMFLKELLTDLSIIYDMNSLSRFASRAYTNETGDVVKNWQQPFAAMEVLPSQLLGLNTEENDTIEHADVAAVIMNIYDQAMAYAYKESKGDLDELQRASLEKALPRYIAGKLKGLLKSVGADSKANDEAWRLSDAELDTLGLEAIVDEAVYSDSEAKAVTTLRDEIEANSDLMELIGDPNIDKTIASIITYEKNNEENATRVGVSEQRDGGLEARLPIEQLTTTGAGKKAEKQTDRPERPRLREERSQFGNREVSADGTLGDAVKGEEVDREYNTRIVTDESPRPRTKETYFQTAERQNRSVAKKRSVFDYLKKRTQRKEESRIEAQYATLKGIVRRNQTVSQLLPVMYDAINSITLDRESDKAITIANIEQAINYQFDSTKNKYLDAKSQALWEKLGRENRAKVISYFLGHQIYFEEGKTKEQVQGNEEALGFDTTNKARNEMTPLGIEYGSEFDDTPEFKLNEVTREGTPTLPVVNNTRPGIDVITAEEVNPLTGETTPESIEETSFASGGQSLKAFNDYLDNIDNATRRLIASDWFKDSTIYKNKAQYRTYLKSIDLIDKLRGLREQMTGAIKLYSILEGLNEKIAKEKNPTYIDKLAAEQEALAKLISTREAAFDGMMALAERYRKEYSPNVKAVNIAAEIKKKQQRLNSDADALAAYQSMPEGWKKLDAAVQQLRYKIEQQQLKGRALLATKALQATEVMSEDTFDKAAESFNKSLPEGATQLTPAKAFDLFFKSGSDFGLFHANLNKLIATAFEESIIGAYVEAKNNRANARDILTARLSVEEKKMYEAMMSGEFVISDEQASIDGKPATDSLGNKVTAKKGRSTSFDYPAATKAKLEYLKGLEQSLATKPSTASFDSLSAKSGGKFHKLGGKERIAKHVASYKVWASAMAEELASITPNTDLSTSSDQVEAKPESEQSTDELLLPTKHKVTVVNVRNELLNRFLGKFANLFDADLITVTADETFNGRYIPNGLDGRAKIVVNVKSGHSIARIFAHELFHHLINKLSPQAYAEFRRAIKESVDKNQWDKAVEKLTNNMSEGKSVKEILTNEFNENPHGTVVKGTLVDGGTSPGARYNPKTNGTEVSFIRTGDAIETRVEKSSAFHGEMPKHVSARDMRNFNYNPENNQSKDLAVVDTSNDKRSIGKETKQAVSAEMREEAENELYSELFAEAIHRESFWEAMSESAAGRGLAMQALVWLGKKTNSLTKMFKGLDNKTWNQRYISSAFKDVNELNNTLAQVVVSALKPGKLRDDIERAFLGEALVLGVGSIAAYKYMKRFSKYSGYKGFMTAMEDVGNDLLDGINKIKPDSWFADYRIEDVRVKRILTKLLHGGNKESIDASIMFRDYKDAFKDDKRTPKENTDYLEEIHDKVVRNHDPEFFASLPKEQQEVFNEMKAVADKLHAEMVELGILEATHKREHHYGQSIKWFFKSGQALTEEFDAILHPELSNLKRSEHFLEAKAKRSTKEIRTQNGMTYKTLDPIEMFSAYVADATQLIRLKEALKELQAIGAMKQYQSVSAAAKDDMKAVNDSAMRVVHEFAYSRADVEAGNKGPFKVKAGETYMKNDIGQDREFRTKEAADIALDEYLKNNEGEAEIEQIKPSVLEDIEFYDVYRERRSDTDASITKGISVTKWERVPEWHRTVNTKAELDKMKAEYDTGEERIVAVPVKKEIVPELKSDMYFNKDAKKLLDVILSEDKIRGSKYGNKIMNAKNYITMLELALSGFHFMTITQEAVSSQAGTLSAQGVVNPFKLLNPWTAFKSAREMKTFINDVISDPDGFGKSKAAKNRMIALLGIEAADAVDLDALDIWAQYANHGGSFHQDDTLKSGIQKFGVAHQMDEDGKFSFAVARESFYKTHEKLAKEHPDNPAAMLGKELLFHAAVTPTVFLMEEMIPRAKFAAFAKEYAQRIVTEQKKLGRKLTADEKTDIGRAQMKFVEDRFGEVNWKNMWLDKTNKSILQFVFRSFTWVAGSWKAMIGSGFDLFKYGWFTVKGEGAFSGKADRYTLTDKGRWGIAAIATHIATVQLINLAMLPFFLAAGDEGEKDDKNVSLVTRMLFARTDPYDNTKRIAFGSYPTEVFKHLSHLGIIGDHRQLSKIWTGRLNGIIGTGVDVLWNNETFDGVTIRNHDDNYFKQAFDVTSHVVGSRMPMSIGGGVKHYLDSGDVEQSIMRLGGFGNAPASSMRSSAANLAFQLGREEHKGKQVTGEEMAIKRELKRAMRKYVEGDKSEVTRLLREGKIAQRELDIATTRYAVLNRRPNPKFKDQLSQGLSRLTVGSAIKVYKVMTMEEQIKHKSEIQKKINKMRARRDTPLEKQKRWIAQWKELQ